jgi:hypothetical protein
MGLGRISWSALVVVSLFALACGPTAEAEDEHTWEGERRLGRTFCGGFAGFPCPKGFTCVDDPRDDCDPSQGGADCAGICRKTPPGRPACTGNEPGHDYVSRDPTQCLAITFNCPEGSSQFFNDCGCGCRRESSGCDYDDPNRTYISKDPDQCAAIRFFCEPGLQPFFDECGCGCEPATP